MGAKNRPAFTFDSLLELQDSAHGVIGASAAATVDSAAQVIDIGTGFFLGAAVIDVSAIEIASNDEAYAIIIEGAQEVAMDTTLVPLARLDVGALEAIPPGSSHFLVDSSIGRYVLYFSNERDGVFNRYIRAYTVVAGTIATGIAWTGYVAKVGGPQ
jgi:hypothetical protein